jgi:hypothetical protein
MDCGSIRLEFGFFFKRPGFVRSGPFVSPIRRPRKADYVATLVGPLLLVVRDYRSLVYSVLIRPKCGVIRGVFTSRKVGEKLL